MRAKLIYEKFTQNSDPIKDLGIGAINIYEKAQNLISSKRGTRGLRVWLDYVKTLIGKTISGKFIKGDLKPFTSKKIVGKIVEKKFKISSYSSYSNATTIVFYDGKKNPYMALKNEMYYIK